MSGVLRFMEVKALGTVQEKSTFPSVSSRATVVPAAAPEERL